MRQSQLNRQVARATGDSIATIKRLGFLLTEPTIPILDPHDPNLGPYVLDWEERLDDLDSLRRSYGSAADAIS